MSDAETQRREFHSYKRTQTVILVLIFILAFVALVLACLAWSNSSGNVTFDSLALTDTSNQIELGTTNTTVLTAPAPGSDIVLTLPTTTDSLIGAATTSTLTNKSLTAPLITNAYGAISTGTTLTAATSGTTYVLTNGTGGNINIALPTVLVSGLNYTFILGGIPNTTITIQAGSAIMYGYIINASAQYTLTQGKSNLIAGTAGLEGDILRLTTNGTHWYFQGTGQTAAAWTAS